MPQATEIVLLCEDKQHERFIRKFLRERNVDRRRIRSVPLPHALGGDAKKWICDHFPEELKAYRSKANNINNILFVVVDVDDETVKKRASALDQACQMRNLPPREKSERVVYILPKWALETWILILDGQILTEDEQVERQHKQKANKVISSVTKTLSVSCKNQIALPQAPPSLIAACAEFQRIAAFI
jgi:hypothetical protein